MFLSCTLSNCKVPQTMPAPCSCEHRHPLEVCLMKDLMSYAACKECQQAGIFTVHFLLCIDNEDILLKRWMVWPLGVYFFQFMAVTLNFFLVIVNGFVQQAVNKEKEYTYLPGSCGHQVPSRQAQSLSHRPYALQDSYQYSTIKNYKFIQNTTFSLWFFVCFYNLCILNMKSSENPRKPTSLLIFKVHPCSHPQRGSHFCGHAQESSLTSQSPRYSKRVLGSFEMSV